MKESLLRRGYAADDNRAEAGAPAPAKESSWYSLFGTALVFVWPDTPMDQVRADRAFLQVSAHARKLALSHLASQAGQAGSTSGRWCFVTLPAVSSQP